MCMLNISAGAAETDVSTTEGVGEDKQDSQPPAVKSSTPDSRSTSSGKLTPYLIFSFHVIGHRLCWTYFIFNFVKDCHNV